MKANELRIGNYVYDEYADGSLYEVQVDIQQMEYPHNCQPIPLTEEWLLKFGFEKVRWGMRKGNLEVRRTVVMFGHHTAPRNLCISLEYVHELQNLYFALKGEELTIIV